MASVLRKAGDILLEICSNVEHLTVAAPYIKVDALDKILNDVKSLSSFVCITRWYPNDLVLGVSDVECRALVIKRGGSFRLHPSLHAKYYRANDVVLIGSANLTFSAMGWTPQSNLEILCRASDSFDSRGFERELLRDSREIDDVEFAQWEALCQIGPQSRKVISGMAPSLSSWRPSTRDPRNLMLAYRGRGEEIASFDEQKAARHEIETLSIPIGLTNEGLRAWICTCLLATPFANSVIEMNDCSDVSQSPNLLADLYGLNATEARRDMETVQNWLSFFYLGASSSDYVVGASVRPS